MDRLTVITENLFYDCALKCMCSFDECNEVIDVYGCGDYCSRHRSRKEDCRSCGIQQAFDRLAAYEDTELTPEEITALRSDNARLHKLLEEFTDTLRKDGTSQ